MAAVYGIGAVLGFTPQDVGKMSVWQFRAAVEGYRKAHDPDAGKGLSEAEADDLFDWIGGS